LRAVGEPDAGRDLPSGTVTFLFTDVEGSTKLLHELGAEGYAEALATHRRILREAFAAHGGVEVDTQGDAFFVAFPTAPGALRAAIAGCESLASGPIRARMGIHTGTPLVTDEGYVGDDVHRAARIAACGHGGQVLVSATTAPLVERELLADLGLHRLKDLSAPERIYQLGEGPFPPLRSLYRTNLPIPATPFLGREAQLEEMQMLLSGDDARLLTLTGPGGTGKTRLALQAAAAAADAYPDGVFWVPLAPLRDPDLVLQGAAQALGADDGLTEHVAAKRLLLLFDNFEHLVVAAPDVGALVGSCPNLRVLVTSREPLHLAGEHELPVPPLAHDEGVELFSARARAIRPDFVPDETVSAICRHLDELPLALELAAARVRALTPEQILARLDQRLPLLTGGARDAPERQRTLRATIEWSHDLLPSDERRLFACLAVFRGGCSLEAAERVCDAELDNLQSLVDKNLLRFNDGRYWMLETIREYATEKLDASMTATQVRDRHARIFLDLAEQAATPLRDVALRGSGAVLEDLEREHDNLRAALDWFSLQGESTHVLQMCGALAEFWFAHDHWIELRGRLLDAVAADNGQPTLERARALIGAADIHGLGGDPRRSRGCADEALAVYRELNDRRGEADALWRIAATIRDTSGDRETRLSGHRAAMPFFEEAAALFRETDDQQSLLNVTRSLAWSHQELGNRDRARTLFRENLQRARALHNPLIESASLGASAMMAAEDRRLQEAFSLASEHLPLAARLGMLHTAEALMRSAFVLARGGHESAAARIVSASEALFEEIGVGEGYWARRDNEDVLARLREALDGGSFAAACEVGRAWTPDEAVAFALEALA
jgi:predicted ATPase/class 3 adenylate cyclase